MEHFTPTNDQIRTQFVSSLMNYFKIEEDVFLRSHIDELIRPIAVTRYSDFLHRLSTRTLSFKTGIEKIALIAQELIEEQLSPLAQEAKERTQKLYNLMYDLRRSITEERNAQHSALARFENVKFTSIKRADSAELLLDSLDIDVIRNVTKQWIYDYVTLDRGLFEARIEREYTDLLLERERAKNTQSISHATQAILGAKRL
ncbi:MAG: hypothetical protein M1300_01535 [Epsilonproteobacteria bacterium]|nr:hypothetical protein [Campylobacterota bacterium]